jgi:hypothetical protein
LKTIFHLNRKSRPRVPIFVAAYIDPSEYGLLYSSPTRFGMHPADRSTREEHERLLVKRGAKLLYRINVYPKAPSAGQ